MGCLDDAQILELISGKMAPDGLHGVDDHLDSCASCRELVLAVARGQASGPVPLPEGARVGRYVVIDEIGRGSFGVVYRAHDPELDRHVALKLLGEDSRSAQEARAMARLGHPNVVAIYEVGRAGAATFLALELVEGETLRSWLASPRSLDAKLAVLLQAGEGIAAAHAAGLVHRDVKPDNIIVGRDGRARVTDFGLARSGAAAAADDAPIDPGITVGALTESGLLLGTPAYMAPEQLMGEDATALSDQFGFCVTVYEALCGERPFRGDTLGDLRAGLREPVPPHAAVPRWVQPILERGLAHEPNARHASLRALLNRLRRDPPRRRSRWALAGAAILAGTALAVGLTLRTDPCGGGSDLASEVWNDAREAKLRGAFERGAPRYAADAMRAVERGFSEWRYSWASAHRAMCTAKAAHGGASSPLHERRMDCLDVQRRNALALLAALERGDADAVSRAPDAVAQLERPERCTSLSPSPVAHAGRQAEQLGSFVDDVAAVRADLAVGRFAAARDAATALAARADEADHDPARGEAHALRAQALLELGALLEADESGLVALRAAERSGDDEAAVGSWLLLASVSGTRGRYKDAADRVRHAEALLGRLGDDLALRARVLNALGVVEQNLGRHDAAAAALEEALAIRKKLHGEEHVEVARTLTNLGNLARARGRLDEALAFHQRAQQIDSSVLGRDHPDAARHFHNLARLALLQGEPADAEALYLKAIEQITRALGPEHPSLGLSHNSLGLLYEQTNADDRAEAAYRRAIALLSASRPGDAAVAMQNLGALLLQRGDHAGALSQLEPALALAASLLGGDHERVAAIALAIGRAHIARGEPDLARTALSRVIAIALENGEAEAHAAEARKLLAPAPPPVRTVPARPPPPPPPPPGGSYLPGQAWD